MKKRILTQAEIDNDPSLRWFPYKYAELLWCDEYQTYYRFVAYEGDSVRLATVNGIARIDGDKGLAKVLYVRRPTGK